jgi:hypothetical protein
MKYLILPLIILSGCAQKQPYKCNCVSNISGATLHDYEITAKDYNEAHSKCMNIQLTHMGSGAKTLDCAIR